jgi:hypothetical protein
LITSILTFSASQSFIFVLDRENFSYNQQKIELIINNVSYAELHFYSNYAFFKNYFNLSSWKNNQKYVIQLGLNIQTLWQNENQKILNLYKNNFLSPNGTKIGEVVLYKSNNTQLDFVDIYFFVPEFYVSYNISNDIIFEFFPPYPGNAPWYESIISNVILESNLPPLHVYIGLEIFDEFNFLSSGSNLQFVSSPNIYLNSGIQNFNVKIGSNLGNIYNNYFSLLLSEYSNLGSPENGLYVGDVEIYIPMEGGYFSYQAIPVYYKIPSPNIEILLGDSFYLTFDPANPQNNYISKVQVTINSSIPTYTINLSLDIFDEYNFIEEYIYLINDQTISIDSEIYSFDIELKADFADLWNENKEFILSQFNESILTVEDQIHIGEVYITITSSSS